MSRPNTGLRLAQLLSLSLVACSLLAGCGFTTKQPAPEPLCPPPQIPAELLRKAPKPEPPEWTSTSTTSMPDAAPVGIPRFAVGHADHHRDTGPGSAVASWNP